MKSLRWSDPEERPVAEDALLERGVVYPPLPPYFYVYGGGYGDGDGGGYGDGDGGGYGGGDGYGYGDGYGDDGGDGGGGGYGDGGGYGGGDGGGYGYGDGYGGGGNLQLQKEAPYMRKGLSIVISPAGSTPFVRIGWCRHLHGDEWEIVEARIIRRFGSYQHLVNIATKGPVDTTELLDPSADPEGIHRLHALRVLVAHEEPWAKHCPRPEGWPV